MSEVSTITNGSWTLEETEGTVQAFEGTGAEFLRVELKIDAGVPKNVTHYKDLPAGTHPATRVRLYLASAPPLQGATKIWTGQMYVSGHSTAVTAFRP